MPSASADTVPATAQGNPVGDLITQLISRNLQQAVTVRGIHRHLDALQSIARANGGNRAAGLPGNTATLRYIQGRLQRAGYRTTVQDFQFPFFQVLAPATFAEVAPVAKTYKVGVDFDTLKFSPSGTLSGRVVPTRDIVIPPPSQPNSTSSGCEASDFPPETAGAIALVQRGTCNYSAKVANAKAAGAIGVVIFNEGQDGRTDANPAAALDRYDTVPVLRATYALGADLYAQAKAGPVTARLTTSTLGEIRTTSNVIGETWFGRSDTVVAVGAHNDSVQAGPGINDDGSGIAANLEIAEQLGRRQLLLRNKVRFIFFGAEEEGLLGSFHYVEQLAEAERKKIKVMLDFDMIASPNYVRFVYDGDGSSFPDTAGPNGSGLIEAVFLAHLAQRNLATSPHVFDGRSDYVAFTNAGIPAGGLYTGSDGVKTAAEARIYGGTAGRTYDYCYHQACDDAGNINDTVLDQFSDAAAHAIVVFGMRREPVVDPVGRNIPVAAAPHGAAYKGPLALR